MIYLKDFATKAEYDAFVESGQMVKPNVSVIAEDFSVKYNKYIPLGVYIQHINNTLFTEAQWREAGFSGNLANGVAVVTNEVAFVIAKNRFQSNWTEKAEEIDGIPSISDRATALKDMRGVVNTAEILKEFGESGAAYLCANYTFPNGAKGYLPALGELKTMVDMAGVSSAMELIGGVDIAGSIWSSTQQNYRNAWYVYTPTELYDGSIKSSVNYVRPFAKL